MTTFIIQNPNLKFLYKNVGCSSKLKLSIFISTQLHFCILMHLLKLRFDQMRWLLFFSLYMTVMFQCKFF